MVVAPGAEKCSLVPLVACASCFLCFESAHLFLLIKAFDGTAEAENNKEEIYWRLYIYAQQESVVIPRYFPSWLAVHWWILEAKRLFQ